MSTQTVKDFTYFVIHNTNQNKNKFKLERETDNKDFTQFSITSSAHRLPNDDVEYIFELAVELHTTIKKRAQYDSISGDFMTIEKITEEEFKDLEV